VSSRLGSKIYPGSPVTRRSRLKTDSLHLPVTRPAGNKTLKLKFYWIGETKDKRLLSLEQDFLARIKKFLPCEIRHVPELKKSDPRSRSAQMAKEGQKLLSMIHPSSTVIVLDETGEERSSKNLAKWMEKSMAGSTSELAFVVGGFWGLPDEIKKKAAKTLSLSRMTFPHEIARVLLLEQVYRAIAINKNLPYHK